MVILPSDGGDHAGEIDLAVEHNPLSWFHLIHILTVIVLIEMMIMIMMVIVVTVMMIIIMTYIHRHVVHQVWFNLWQPTRSHCRKHHIFKHSK